MSGFKGASRSSGIALDVTGQLVAALSPESDRLVTFAAEADEKSPRGSLRFAPGSMPVSVALHPDGDQAFVVLRKTQQLVRVRGFPWQLKVDGTVPVGAEPTGVALSPSGRWAVVTNYAEASVSLVDTVTLAARKVALPDHPRAVAITNDLDGDDLDESAWITLFYGKPVSEGTDDGRVGQLVELVLATGRLGATIDLGPIDTGESPPLSDGGRGAAVKCSPNQLFAIAIADQRAFVVHVCAAPQGPVFKFTNVFAGLSVVDLVTRQELRGPNGSMVLTRAPMPQTLTRFGLPVDVDVDPTGNFVAVLAQAANRVAELRVTRGQPLTLFSAGPAGHSCAYPFGCFDGGFGFREEDPSGVPVALVKLNGSGVFVVDGTGRMATRTGGGMPPARVSLDLLPAQGSPELAYAMGKKFFYTAADRWSDQEVSSCASCHPDGLTDNLTWVFPAGPRQTTPLDGTFARQDPMDHRAQNWTANFDEIYDVEGNTRGTSGGKGAITSGFPPLDTPIALGVGISLDGGTVAGRNDNLSGSSRVVAQTLSKLNDWTRIETYVQQIVANRAPTALDAVTVANGRAVFAAAGCTACHAGPKWTVSRVPYEPSPEKNGSLAGENGVPFAATGLRTQLRQGFLPAFNLDTFKVAIERRANPDGGADLTVGPERITCVLRDVGTWDPFDPLERKSDGTRAQGAMGFNPPSLLGLATSAPYFHHGAARTLQDVFSPRFATHTRAGSPGLTLTGPQVSALITFLTSIDDSTAPFPSSAGVDICDAY